MHEPPSPSSPPTQSESAIDPLTVICIAILAYLLAIPVIHEGIGHGLTAILLGARDIRLSSAVLHFDDASVSIEKFRIINIAGPLGSLIGGCLLVLYYRASQASSATFRYLLWLTAYVCLFQAGGYLMVLSFVNFGDINGFVTGLPFSILLRASLTVIGTVLSFLALFSAGRDLDPFLGMHRRRLRAAKLVVISYFAGSGAQIFSTFLNPNTSVLTLAIPATLGGTIFLLYVILAVRRVRPTTNPVPLPLEKSGLWYAAGLAGLLLYGFVLGPGIP